MNTAKVCLDCVGSQTHINGCRQGLGCEIELGPKKDANEEHEDADTGKDALQCIAKQFKGEVGF